MSDNLLTVKEVAQRLRMSEASVYGLSRRGDSRTDASAVAAGSSASQRMLWKRSSKPARSAPSPSAVADHPKPGDATALSGVTSNYPGTGVRITSPDDYPVFVMTGIGTEVPPSTISPLQKMDQRSTLTAHTGSAATFSNGIFSLTRAMRVPAAGH